MSVFFWLLVVLLVVEATWVAYLWRNGRPSKLRWAAINLMITAACLVVVSIAEIVKVVSR